MRNLFMAVDWLVAPQQKPSLLFQKALVALPGPVREALPTQD
jgi:hypothetical protein